MRWRAVPAFILASDIQEAQRPLSWYNRLQVRAKSALTRSATLLLLQLVEVPKAKQRELDVAIAREGWHRPV